MKYIQFTYKDKPNDLRVGYLEGSCVVDINKRDSCIPSNMLEYMRNETYIKRILEYKRRLPHCQIGLKDVCLKAPICGMDKIIGAGFNYKDCKVKKKNAKFSEYPWFFNKFASCIIGPNDPLLLRTDVAKKVDYEAELCAVIGKKATCVPACYAYEYVFGYTIAQDITDREWRLKNGNQVLLAKAMDTFCAIGPWIVTSDEIGNPEDLEIYCKVNGIYRQRSNTKHMITYVPKMIERLSSIMTLLPGDIILTGTPKGTGLTQKPPLFLKPGDVIFSEIEKIGTLETRVEKYVNPINISAGFYRENTVEIVKPFESAGSYPPTIGELQAEAREEFAFSDLRASRAARNEHMEELHNTPYYNRPLLPKLPKS